MATSGKHKAVSLVDQLFNAAFDPTRMRDPRSPEYKAGVRAVLEYRINGTRIRCSYPAASARSDAYHAGVTEGHAIWRAHQDAQSEGA